MDFNYFDINNIKRTLNLQVGDSWKDLGAEHEFLNSIFSQVDDGDGKVSNLEITTFQKLFKYADTLLKNTKGNNNIEAEEITELQNILDKGKIDTNTIIRSITPEDLTLEALEKRFPSDEYTVGTGTRNNHPAILVWKDVNGNMMMCFEVIFSEDGKPIRFADFSGEQTLKGTFENNKLATYTFNEETVSIKNQDIAASLYEQIYAKNNFGFPITAENLGDTIKEINADNVIEIMEHYSKTDKKSPSLINDIMGEIGLQEKRIEYIMHIKNAIIEHYKNLGVVVDDISAEFDKEIQYQMDKITPLNGEYLDILIKQLSDREDALSVEGAENTSPNGVIDSEFAQGTTGDCWLLASLIAINNTPKGKEILEKTLKVNDDGSVTVHLQGVDKTYTITEEELENNSQLATGDMDVRAIEIAMNKYFKEERGVNNHLDINANRAAIAYEILTGETCSYARKNYSFNYNANKGSLEIVSSITQNRIGITDDIIDNFNTENLVTTVSSHSIPFSEVSEEYERDFILYNNHAYTVKSADEEFVYLINPHNSKKTISISRTLFKKFFNRISQTML